MDNVYKFLKATQVSSNTKELANIFNTEPDLLTNLRGNPGRKSIKNKKRLREFLTNFYSPLSTKMKQLCKADLLTMLVVTLWVLSKENLK